MLQNVPQWAINKPQSVYFRYQLCHSTQVLRTCPQATTTGSGATLPTMLALVWCSGWPTALRTERPSWTRSRLRSRGTGGHGPLKVCRDTETSRPEWDTCTKIRFTSGTKRKRSAMSLYTCEYRMPLRTLRADWLWGLTVWMFLKHSVVLETVAPPTDVTVWIL